MGPWTSFELSILEAIQNIRNPILDKIIVDISTLGNASLIWIIMTIIFLSTRQYKRMGHIMIIAFVANIIIVNLVLKNIFGRIRPYEYVNGLDLLIPLLSDGSFPSGHSSYAATFATIILFMSKDKILKILIGILTILIAFSRLYLFVHFPTDVIAGLIIGITIAIFSMKFYFDGTFDKLLSKLNLQKK